MPTRATPKTSTKASSPAKGRVSVKVKPAKSRPGPVNAPKKVTKSAPSKTKAVAKPSTKKTPAPAAKAPKVAKSAKATKAAKATKTTTVSPPAKKAVAAKPVAPPKASVSKPAATIVKAPAVKAPPVKAAAVKAPSKKPVRYTGPLTEEILRTMGDADYMSEAQLGFFRERLMQMRQEVLAREVDVKERLHQREIFADPADRATAEEEHWLDLRLRERESLLLRKIDEALKRISDRDYGYCEKTGDPIGIPRLLARPTATVCVDIKGQDERVEAQYRDR